MNVQDIQETLIGQRVKASFVNVPVTGIISDIIDDKKNAKGIRVALDVPITVKGSKIESLYYLATYDNGTGSLYLVEIL